MQMTEKGIAGLFDDMESFSKHARKVAAEHAKITGRHFSYAAHVVWEHSNSLSILLLWFEYFHNEAEQFDYELPTRFLYENGWQDELRAEMEAKKVEEDRAAEVEAREAAIRHEAYEQSEYKRLRAKYGDSE